MKAAGERPCSQRARRRLGARRDSASVLWESETVIDMLERRRLLLFAHDREAAHYELAGAVAPCQRAVPRPAERGSEACRAAGVRTCRPGEVPAGASAGGRR